MDAINRYAYDALVGISSLLTYVVYYPQSYPVKFQGLAIQRFTELASNDPI